MNNKLDIKIAFFDIDGTLTNSNHEITKRTIDTLNKLKRTGIEIVICSGRTNTYVCNYLNQINNAKYAISSNGAEIYDYENRKNIFTDKMDFSEVKDIWNYCKMHEISFVLNTISERYSNNFTLRRDGKTFVSDIDFLYNENVFQIVTGDFNYKKMKNLELYIKNLNNTYIINYSFDYMNNKETGNHWFDIVKTNVNKGNAIKILLEKLNIDKSKAICFGDGINDIDMFESCGIKVAMGNAIEIIKEKADYITDSNDDEGITNYFNKYFF